MRVKVDKLGINGEGVIRSTERDVKVCFVDYCLPGEIVDIDIVDAKKHFNIARLNDVIQSSRDRVLPKCPYFYECGGCNLMHMNIDSELKFKQQMVSETINKIAKLGVEVADTVMCQEYRYRNKMVFPICDVKGKPILGMFRSASHSILEIDDCLLCNASISKVMQITRKWLKNSIFKGFNFNKKSGDLMYLVVREHSNQILVTIVASREVELKSLYDCYIQSFDNIGLSLIISDLSGDILSGKYIHLYGKENININEFGVSYCIDSRGFLQVNNEIKNKLYQEVLDNIDIDASVIDAYSGAGLLSAIIAKKAKEVVAIEINKSASNSAKQLFLNNNIDNIKNICADVGAVLLKELKLMDNITIVLDPPRSGCSKEVFDSINRMSDCNKINKIIYISCNPSTLARDLSILKERYIIDSVRPYNMFPRTKHIETLVCLQRQV